jgi:hypothetical protein
MKMKGNFTDRTAALSPNHAYVTSPVMVSERKVKVKVILMQTHCSFKSVTLAKLINHKQHSTWSYLKAHKITLKQARQARLVPNYSLKYAIPLPISKTPYHYSSCDPKESRSFWTEPHTVRVTF